MYTVHFSPIVHKSLSISKVITPLINSSKVVSPRIPVSVLSLSPRSSPSMPILVKLWFSRLLLWLMVRKFRPV